MEELITMLQAISSLEEEGLLVKEELTNIADTLDKKLERTLGSMNYALVKKLCTLQNN